MDFECENTDCKDCDGKDTKNCPVCNGANDLIYTNLLILIPFLLYQKLCKEERVINSINKKLKSIDDVLEFVVLCKMCTQDFIINICSPTKTTVLKSEGLLAQLKFNKFMGDPMLGETDKKIKRAVSKFYDQIMSIETLDLDQIELISTEGYLLMIFVAGRDEDNKPCILRGNGTYFLENYSNLSQAIVKAIYQPDDKNGMFIKWSFMDDLTNSQSEVFDVTSSDEINDALKQLNFNRVKIEISNMFKDRLTSCT